MLEWKYFCKRIFSRRPLSHGISAARTQQTGKEAFIVTCARWRGCRSRVVGKRDLSEGELPAFRSSVPDVGEARFLLERLIVVGAAQPDPAAEDDGIAEIAGEGRLDDVGICVGAGMADQLNQSGLVRDLAAGADENVIVGNQLFQLCAIALTLLRPVVALRGRSERLVGQVVVVGLVRGRRLLLAECRKRQEQERTCRHA
jgi:hypothetical protein